MQQRYYDPQIGRFLNTDPASTDPNTGATLDRYTYASNNPYRFTDPDGREALGRGSVVNRSGSNGGMDFMMSGATFVPAGSDAVFKSDRSIAKDEASVAAPKHVPSEPNTCPIPSRSKYGPFIESQKFSAAPPPTVHTNPNPTDNVSRLNNPKLDRNVKIGAGVGAAVVPAVGLVALNFVGLPEAEIGEGALLAGIAAEPYMTTFWVGLHTSLVGASVGGAYTSPTPPPSTRDQ
jgi:uncharacterized protein RhaS with RHS repeats